MGYTHGKRNTPNAETVAALEEADRGGGEVFHGATEEALEAILADLNEEWQPMNTAPHDTFALYRLADGAGEYRGCIDSIRPTRIWIVTGNKGEYLHLDRFDGWKCTFETRDSTDAE